jgi:hypothetical protein
VWTVPTTAHTHLAEVADERAQLTGSCSDATWPPGTNLVTIPGVPSIPPVSSRYSGSGTGIPFLCKSSRALNSRRAFSPRS